jgi:conjugal transfer/entry exclusion protein
MNNIFLNNDPLLAQPTQQYVPQFMTNEAMMIPKDWLGELDRTLKNLEPSVLEQLNINEEFVALHGTVQNTIQEELMNLVKNKLNLSSPIIENVKRQLTIIKDVSNKTKEIERQSMSELSDYMKNYSHLTFDEYKKIKSGETLIEMENKKKK